MGRLGSVEGPLGRLFPGARMSWSDFETMITPTTLREQGSAA